MSRRWAAMGVAAAVGLLGILANPEYTSACAAAAAEQWFRHLGACETQSP